jgi:hypothetical protein
MANDTIRIVSNVPSIIVEMLLDSDGARITGGYGGWDTIARPRRQALTDWIGRGPFTMTVSAILDGHMDGTRVEGQCHSLERLALPHPNPGGQPPVVRLAGAAVPHNDLEYVIENIEWGDTMRDNSGNRTRQHVVVNFLRYVAVDKIQFTAAAKIRAKTPKVGKTITTKKGDTLAKIAARELGDSTRVNEIRQLNPGIRDPNKVPPTVKIPPREKRGGR